MISKIRYIPLFCSAFGFILCFFQPHPSILISGDARLFGIANADTLYLSNNVSNRYSKKIWMQTLGYSNTQSIKKSGMERCSSKLCIYDSDSGIIAISADIDTFMEACNIGPKVFINLQNNQKCPTAGKNITVQDLLLKGAHALWEDGRVEYSVNSIVRDVHPKDSNSIATLALR